MKSGANGSLVNQQGTSTQVINNPYENQSVPYENIKRLEEQATGLGFQEHFDSMVKGKIIHDEKEITCKFFDYWFAEKVLYEAKYLKHAEGEHNLEGITATLYHKIDIEYGVINGIDTKKLETELKNLDWSFERFRWGREVEDALRLISRDDETRHIAMALWNNNVRSPLIIKPDFISDYEKESGVYITRSFTPNTDTEGIYTELKERQLINQKLSVVPLDILHNSHSKSAIIEQLLQNEQYRWRLPTNAFLKKEMEVSWDRNSSTLTIVDNKGNPYQMDKDGYLKKVKHEIQKNVNQVSSPIDDSLLPKHRHNNNKGLTK